MSTKEIKDTKISTRIRSSEKAAIEKIAARKDISVAQLIREAIRDYIQKEKNYDR